MDEPRYRSAFQRWDLRDPMRTSWLGPHLRDRAPTLALEARTLWREMVADTKSHPWVAFGVLVFLPGLAWWVFQATRYALLDRLLWPWLGGNAQGKPPLWRRTLPALVALVVATPMNLPWVVSLTLVGRTLRVLGIDFGD